MKYYANYINRRGESCSLPFFSLKVAEDYCYLLVLAGDIKGFTIDVYDCDYSDYDGRKVDFFIHLGCDPETFREAVRRFGTIEAKRKYGVDVDSVNTAEQGEPVYVENTSASEQDNTVENTSASEQGNTVENTSASEQGNTVEKSSSKCFDVSFEITISENPSVSFYHHFRVPNEIMADVISSALSYGFSRLKCSKQVLSSHIRINNSKVGICTYSSK